MANVKRLFCFLGVFVFFVFYEPAETVAFEKTVNFVDMREVAFLIVCYAANA